MWDDAPPTHAMAGKHALLCLDSCGRVKPQLLQKLTAAKREKSIREERLEGQTHRQLPCCLGFVDPLGGILAQNGLQN
jgi:hypothetical protein